MGDSTTVAATFAMSEAPDGLRLPPPQLKGGEMQTNDFGAPVVAALCTLLATADDDHDGFLIVKAGNRARLVMVFVDDESGMVRHLLREIPADRFAEEWLDGRTLNRVFVVLAPDSEWFLGDLLVHNRAFSPCHVDCSVQEVYDHLPELVERARRPQ